MTLALIIAAILAALGGAYYFVRAKAEKAPVVQTPLPLSPRKQILTFCPWNLDGFSEKAWMKHGLVWHCLEAFGVYKVGHVGQVCTPSLNHQFDPQTVAAGLDTRARLKRFNPDVLLLGDIGYREARDQYTDIPPDHRFWKRLGGERVRGWIGFENCYLLDIDNPDYRSHIAEAAKAAADTGVWDGLFFDCFEESPAHSALLLAIRAKLPNFPIIVNCNAEICPSIAHWCNGILMECGPVTDWKKIEDAVDFNERHTRQPSMNCLEVSGLRTDQRALMNATCLALTSMNGFVLYCDPGPAGIASAHTHAFHEIWERDLGRPLESTRFEGNRRVRRFERGTVVYDPIGGSSIV